MDMEIAKIAKILDRDRKRWPLKVAFIELLMYTATRPSAIRRLRKSQYTKHVANGVTYGVCFFPGKSGVEKLVFNPRAVEIIDSLWGRTQDDLILDIPFPKGYWSRVRTEAGCPDAWARDWRRTGGSLALASGTHSRVIKDLLNHKSEKMTDLYTIPALESVFLASSNLQTEVERRSHVETKRKTKK